KTAGEGSNITLEMMPQPMFIQSMIFSQRDLYRERVEHGKRESVRNEIVNALGMGGSPTPLSAQPRRSDEGSTGGLPFIRTKFRAANGDIVYRKHATVWLQH